MNGTFRFDNKCRNLMRLLPARCCRQGSPRPPGGCILQRQPVRISQHGKGAPCRDSGASVNTLHRSVNASRRPIAAGRVRDDWKARRGATTRRAVPAIRPEAGEARFSAPAPGLAGGRIVEEGDGFAPVAGIRTTAWRPKRDRGNRRANAACRLSFVAGEGQGDSRTAEKGEIIGRRAAVPWRPEGAGNSMAAGEPKGSPALRRPCRPSAVVHKLRTA